MTAWIMTLLLTAARTLGGGLDAHPAPTPAAVAEAWAAVEARAAGDAAVAAPASDGSASGVPASAAGEAAEGGEAARTWASPRAYERFLVGLVALRRGDTATAVRALREARLLDPEAAPVHRCLAEALRRARGAEGDAAAAAGRPGGDCAAEGPPAHLAPGDPAP